MGSPFLAIFDGLFDDALCLSIGGGPRRDHIMLTNLNIGPYPNVDICADAHLLPYTNESVDAIYCDATLEHLKDPHQAVREMYRVLKKGRKIYVSTPFLQAFHGYPHHYQNYTLTGHKYLFEINGFKSLEVGTAVGPTYTIVSLISTFIAEYSPALLQKLFRIAWGLAGAFIRPLDIILAKRENAYIMASTTYILAVK